MCYKLAYHLLSIYVLTVSVLGFEFPSNYSSDLAVYSNVTVTSTCSNGGSYSCNATCPNRVTFPPLPDGQIPLKSKSITCKDYTPSSPDTAVAANGGIVFDSTTTECVEHSVTYSSASPNYFSLTLWMEASCQDETCDILSIGTSINMTYNGNNLRLNTADTTADKTADSGDWHFIVIRYNGKYNWYVDGQWIDTSGLTSSPTPTASYELTLGPATNLTSLDHINLMDVRWYKDVLTDREVTKLYKNTPLDIGLKSECRCPATHPTLVEDRRPIHCTNGIDEVLRLGTNAYIPAYMLDNDGSTSWISENIPESNITISLNKEYQIKGITLEGIKHVPSTLNIILFRNGVETNRVTIISVSSEKAVYNFESDSITERSKYRQLVTDKVIIQAKFTPSNHFTVSDLSLEARCNCHGNDKECSIINGNFTCDCDQSSNTESEYCDECTLEFYRPADGFTCPSQCQCNTTGSIDNICAQEGGQCNCRANVEGRQCSKCKHNTANFGATGCEACDCNPDGITSCGDNRICNCKTNVESSTGKCEACLPNYYDISKSSGCTDCDCHISGTMNGQPECDTVTGQCRCKDNVQDRRCSMCKNEYFGLAADKENGCEACGCNIVGSKSLVCDKTTGSCQCVDGQDHAADDNRQCIPKNLRLEPTFGPIAGGTLLTLTGTLLGNSSVTFRLGNIDQEEVSRNLTQIIFRTKEGSEGEKGVSLFWTDQGSTYTYHAKEIEDGTKFMYKKNPQMLIPSSNIRSYTSGGCALRLQGSNLDSVPHPKMLVYVMNNGKTESACAEEGGHLKCFTPKLPEEHFNETSYFYGFKMDGVTKYENASSTQDTMLIALKDPIVYTGMSETFRNTFDKIFRVKGERLHEACHDSDITISLGDKNCAILSRTQDSISCDPGEDFPGTARTVTVKVKIGNFEKEWGRLKINSFWTNTEFIAIAIGTGVFLILVVVGIVCIIRCRRKNSYKKYDNSNPATENYSLDEHTPHIVSSKSKLPVSANPSRTKRNDYETNPVAVILPIEKKPAERTSKMIADDFCNRLKKNVGKIVKTSIIETSNVDIGKLCTHKGKKIRVVNGLYNASSSSPYSGNSLTIKTLVEPYTEEGDLPDWINNGLQECTRLQDFANDNVLRMKGIAVDAKNIYIIYPEMSNRTLKDYLFKSKEPLSAERKLEICFQVADGMNYLSSLGVVHKDLAARNCWVARDFEVKISDASFSYDLYPEEYLESNGRYQPVRWMAPESLRQGYYDTKSDVWSYGVLIWEVYTDGYLPYYDITKNEEVRSKVCDQQYRLGKPYKDCPEAIFQLMEECHIVSSNDRPDFNDVQQRLDRALNPEDQTAHLYENHAFTTAAEDDLEDYVNTRFKISPPPRPARGMKT